MAEEIEVHKGEASHLGSNSQEMTEPGFKVRPLWSPREILAD